jgi:hypothetical protein
VRWWTSLIELYGCVITSSSTSRLGHSSVEITGRYTLASAAETADALEHVTIGSGPTPRSATVRSTTHAHSPAHIR